MKFKNEANKLYSNIWQEGDKFYKKREVFPPFDREGNIRWKEFLIGNWKVFLITLFIIALTIGLAYEYITNLQIGAECLAREEVYKTITTTWPTK